MGALLPGPRHCVSLATDGPWPPVLRRRSHAHVHCGHSTYVRLLVSESLPSGCPMCKRWSLLMLIWVSAPRQSRSRGSAPRRRPSRWRGPGRLRIRCWRRDQSLHPARRPDSTLMHLASCVRSSGWRCCAAVLCKDAVPSSPDLLQHRQPLPLSQADACACQACSLT